VAATSRRNQEPHAKETRFRPQVGSKR